MNKVWHIFRYEFWSNFRRRSYLLTTFAIPLVVGALVLALTGLMANSLSDDVVKTIGETVETGANAVVGMVDQSGLFAAPEPGSRFEAAIQPFDSEDAARSALETDAVRAYYVIPQDYLEGGQILRYAKQFDLLDSLGDMSLVQDYLTAELAGDIDPNVTLRLQDPVNFEERILAPAAVEESGEEQPQEAANEAVTFLVPYLFGILMMIGTLFASGYLMSSVTQEKESRTIEILLSSVKPFPLLTAKVLASGALGLFQIVVYLLTMWFLAPRAATQIAALAGLQIPPQLMAAAVVYFLGGFLLVGGVYAAMGALAPRMQDAQQIAGFMVIPFVIPLAFISTFIEAPNDPFPVVLSLFPFTSPLAMVMRVSATTVPLIEIVVSLVLLAAGAIGSIWLAGRLFRVNTLLAGQAPRLRDLLYLLREG